MDRTGLRDRQTTGLDARPAIEESVIKPRNTRRENGPGSGFRVFRVFRGAIFPRRPSSGAPGPGFSLIEMLVVMAVIGVLAAMIFPVTKAVNRNKIKSRTRAEMAQVATAIEIYKSKRGHYPPDNHFPNGAVNPYVNQLYYELAGTTNWVANGDVYFQTSDGQSQPIDGHAISLALGSGVSGFVNSSTGESVEEGSKVVNCLGGAFRADQIAQTPGGFKFLVCSIPLPPNLPYKGSAQLNTSSPTAPWYCAWRYNSSSPTNNTSSFDLWVDVIIDGKTNRFSNWSGDAVIVGSP